MNQSARSTSILNPTRLSDPTREEENRKKRLMLILSKGLPTLPGYLLDLNALLTSASVDLKKVGKVIRTDPSLTAQVLRLCNSAMFGLRRRVVSIEQASVLIGTERLRTLVLTCSVMQFAGERVPANLRTIFWQHSFLAALLSERIADQMEYAEKEQAYLGGQSGVGTPIFWDGSRQGGSLHGSIVEFHAVIHGCFRTSSRSGERAA